MIEFIDKLWPILLLYMRICYADYENVDENVNSFRTQLKDIYTALDQDYTDAQTNKEKENTKLYASETTKTDHASRETEQKSSKFMAELYDLYAQAMETDEESITRRLFKDGKNYTMHIKKLKDVNGLKTHNLRVSDDTSLLMPIIYINNPVESHLPYTFLSREQFKKAFIKNAKKQRKDIYKVKTVAQNKRAKRPNVMKTKQITHKKVFKGNKDKPLKYATEKKRNKLTQKNVNKNKGKPKSQNMNTPTKKGDIVIKHKNVYKENNLTSKIIKYVTNNKELKTTHKYVLNKQTKIKTVAVTVKAKIFYNTSKISEQPTVLTKKPQENTEIANIMYKPVDETTTGINSYDTNVTFTEIDATTTRNNFNDITMDAPTKSTQETSIVKSAEENVNVKTTTPITTTTKQGRPYVFMGNPFEKKNE